MPTERSACRCVVCRDYGDRDARDSFELRIAELVESPGWMVAAVPADDQGDAFAYTIGLRHSFGTPEVAMFGLDPYLMQELLNVLGEKAAAGLPLADGSRHGDVIDGHDVLLRQARGGWYPAFFGRALSFYRAPFPVLQVLWPDRKGRFPGEPDVDDSVRARQPQTWLRPTEHADDAWKALVAD
ncbi:DUF4262 domain-containing protein [Yinghuangia soli]|uniref:DUF4262 domain-containing protein n=1 Tax=Yinghuangia soli TaxID=2908204 RepID=A0AA41Q0S9_9ACTN|nr:DUF4262 domain-containing protein [Yinghuangia soli]MCF2529117.1 DUF4262 domain-containing protein [Yinghuangia soli]